MLSFLSTENSDDCFVLRRPVEEAALENTMVLHAAPVSWCGDRSEPRDERVFGGSRFPEPSDWFLRRARLLPLLWLRRSLPRKDPQKWPRLDLAQKHSARPVRIYSSGLWHGS